jgi:hypothetical protein
MKQKSLIKMLLLFGGVALIISCTQQQKSQTASVAPAQGFDRTILPIFPHLPGNSLM